MKAVVSLARMSDLSFILSSQLASTVLPSIIIRMVLYLVWQPASRPCNVNQLICNHSPPIGVSRAYFHQGYDGPQVGGICKKVLLVRSHENIAILVVLWISTFCCFLSYSLRWYAARMVLFGLALLIAARPDLDNPGCYRETWDGLRGICEIISLIFFSYKFIEEIWLMNR